MTAADRPTHSHLGLLGHLQGVVDLDAEVSDSASGANLQDRWFFLYGFEKKDRETIDARELAALQTVAAALLAMDQKLLEKAVAESELEEICREEKSPAE